MFRRARRPRHLSPTPARASLRRTASLGVTVVAALAVATGAAGPGLAQPSTLAHAAYVPAGTGAWLNDTPLGRTDGSDQYAQAHVSGVTDGGQQVGFLMRYAARTSRILVTVSGTGWRIEPSGAPALAGTFAHGPSGLLRVEARGTTVRIVWNASLVTSRQVGGGFPGRSVVATVRQARRAVALRLLRAGTPTSPATTGTALPGTGGTTGGTTSATVGNRVTGTWLSGASSPQAADGSYGAWRGAPVQIGGTWNDTYDAQLNEWSICEGGEWSGWDKPLDVAVGGIYRSRGDSWAAAARGAYDARWTAVLDRIKACWGSRDGSLLYLRFAHEMNLPMDWSVRHGEEADFVKAITRFSTLRYRIIPRAKIVLCTNDGTSGSLNGLDIRKLWPAKDSAGRLVANIYATDSYNQYPFVNTVAGFTRKINGQYPNGMPLGIEKHRRFAASVGVPFAIGEWSNNADPTSDGDGGGGESPLYVQQFNAWLRAHSGDVAHPAPGQILYEIHFNLWSQFQFWPVTIQPRTAAAYRALPWGH